ncbi:MAG: FAD-dependent monooxygenase [Beijerinckiaceae bacterium]|nr:FAD-dependent monooxygenase [Beijerinckiaceae bacterium]MCZ8299694.1 FAD-dependent monooxygenase [Beijerinckiaceae bacterium]
MSRSDVTIVGGGAAGLSAALGLAQAGLTVHLLGAPTTIRDDGRSAALFQTSLDFLAGLGLGPALQDRASALRAIRIIDLTGGLVRAPTTTFRALEIGQDAFGWNIANADILAVMMEAARHTPGLTLSDAQFRGFRTVADSIIVEMEDGSNHESRLLVGADGQNSKTREAAGIAFRTKDYPQTALTCRLRHPKDHEDISTEFHTREGPFTFVPSGDGISALVWIMRPDKAEGLLALPRERLAEIITRRASSFLGPFEIISAIGAVPMRKRVADRLVAGRVALIGEAAHAFPPIGAQGLNLGLKDVESLVRRLVAAHREGTDLTAALPLYAQDRKLDMDMRATGVDLMNSALIADFLPLDITRALALTALKQIAPLRQLAMRIGSWTPPFGQKRSA